MGVEIAELLEDEYAAQQEGALHIQTSVINGGNEKKPEPEVAALLADISETLRLLNEQIVLFNAITKILPETVSALKTTTEAVNSIANELPIMVREQCLEEYKKILANAVKNYNQMQKRVVHWQTSIQKEWVGSYKLIAISAILTPMLLFLLLISK